MSARPLALVVDDSEDQIELLRRYLRREGYDTFAALDAETAVAAFDDIDPALAIVDLLLPGIPGGECARRVRDRFPECLLVISSVLDVADYPAADGKLPKPVRGAELHELLERMRA
ncbi:response regulator transcription factor [uncultured Microbacterium sp.]|uniref:response regulator transcription factor n=1 Tax=uncultured Microbacterium sp. TaxID=191216 RepID=UPI0025DDC055|nr:response regulator [uncultured Microbacterium sp.]